MWLTPEQFVAVLGAITALVVALTAVFAQLRRTHMMVNGRLTELLKLTHDAALAKGKLAGSNAPPSPPPAP